MTSERALWRSSELTIVWRAIRRSSSFPRSSLKCDASLRRRRIRTAHLAPGIETSLAPETLAFVQVSSSAIAVVKCLRLFSIWSSS